MFYMIIIIMSAIGLCVGSFLNVVIYRLPRGESIAYPSSHCPDCGHPLKWYDNIPVISWLMLRARCRYCGSAVSARYPLVEISGCLLWVIAFACKKDFFTSLIYAAVLSVLLVIAYIDAENKEIPDKLQHCLLLLSLTIVRCDDVWGFVVGGGIMVEIYLLGFLLFGREALGYGDVKPVAVTSLLLGWQGALIAIALSFLLAAVGAIAQRLLKSDIKRESELAFAPALAYGISVALLLGRSIADWYINFLL